VLWCLAWLDSSAWAGRQSEIAWEAGWDWVVWWKDLRGRTAFGWTRRQQFDERTRQSSAGDDQTHGGGIALWCLAFTWFLYIKLAFWTKLKTSGILTGSDLVRQKPYHVKWLLLISLFWPTYMLMWQMCFQPFITLATSSSEA